jgi:two-component system cell cycle response regulator
MRNENDPGNIALAQERLTPEYRCALLYEINQAIEISELLALLGRELERLGQPEGYLVNLLDETEENLVCEHIQLPASFGGVESTYLKCKFPLDAQDANARTCLEREAVTLTSANLSSYPGATAMRFERWRMRELLIVPIRSDELVLGTVMLFRVQGLLPESLAPAVEQLLTLFSRPLRAAIRHRNLREKEHLLNQALSAQRQFLRFITQVNSLTSTETIYDMISVEFLNRFPFDMVGILTREDELISLRKLSVRSERHEPIRQLIEHYYQDVHYRLDPADGASAYVFLRNDPLFFPDGRKIVDLPMSAKDRGSLERMRPRTIFILPIRHNTQPLGVLWLVSLDEPVPISESDQEFIDLLCSFIGTAMANAELYTMVGQQKQEIEQLNESLREKMSELRLLASRDRLTGLANFGAFEAELARRTSEYQRQSGDRLSLVLFDVDRFKLFNDTYGHLAGNMVLQEIAKRLQAVARAMDMPCRYGGEEFVVILPKCDREGARIFAERIRRAVEATPVGIGKESVTVTISVGCACFEPGETTQGFLERADKALYLAKENGRNRVELAS